MTKLFESTRLRRLDGMDDEKVKNAFFANYFAALIMLRLEDPKGLTLIKDRANVNLLKVRSGMSDVNFWAMVLFFSDRKEFKDRLSPMHSELLAVEAGRVMLPRIKKIVSVMTKDPASVNWHEVSATLVLLRERFSVRSTHFRNLLYYMVKWDSLKESQKKKAVNTCYMYLMQSDQRSSLMGRMRDLQSNFLLKFAADISRSIVNFGRLAEDGGGDGGSAGTGGTAGGVGDSGSEVGDTPTTTGSVASHSYRFTKKRNPIRRIDKYKVKNNKLIKRRVKKFKAKKFKAPDWMTQGSTYGAEKSGDTNA